MKALKTSAILIAALCALFAGQIFMTGYYPAAKPVLAADGSPVLDHDGKPILHRDMKKYYEVNRTAFIFMGASACLFGWWLVRVSKHLYACFQEGRKAT